MVKKFLVKSGTMKTPFSVQEVKHNDSFQDSNDFVHDLQINYRTWNQSSVWGLINWSGSQHATKTTNKYGKT